jgi:hypothetical protein
MEKLKTFLIAIYLKSHSILTVYLNIIEKIANLIAGLLVKFKIVDEQSASLTTTITYIVLHIVILSIICFFIF